MTTDHSLNAGIEQAVKDLIYLRSGHAEYILSASGFQRFHNHVRPGRGAWRRVYLERCRSPIYHFSSKIHVVLPFAELFDLCQHRGRVFAKGGRQKRALIGQTHVVFAKRL